jgi:hypothetical protein
VCVRDAASLPKYVDLTGLRIVATRELIIQTYYSQGDEDAFFDRLNGLGCVRSVKGAPDGLHIALSTPTDMQLRELIALLYRYGLNLKPLAVLRTDKNAEWFAKNRKAFWYAGVFGKLKT